MASESWAIDRLVLILLLLMVATGTVAATISADSVAREDDAQACGQVTSVPAAWSPSERWAWRQICQGQSADFDAAFGTQEISGQQSDERFLDARRKLTADFLSTLLSQEPYRSAIPPEGVKIRGATFEGDVILRDAVLVRVLGVFDSKFLGKLEMNRLRTPTSVAFTGSIFEKELSLDSANIGGNLNMIGGDFGEIVLKTAEIRGDLSMTDSHVTGLLNMNGARVGGTLFLRDATFNGVDLTEVTIGRQLSTRGSTFKGSLNMGSLATGSHVFMNQGSSYADVDMQDARIGGHFSLSGAEFLGEFYGGSISVEQDLIMTGATFDHPVDLPMIRVGGSMYVSGVTLGGLNLYGATVNKDLYFRDFESGRVQWRRYTDNNGMVRDPIVILFNASVGTLLDEKGSWPQILQLSLRDFKYDRLIPFGEHGNRLGELRDATWYIDWLANDLSNSFQPYWQLAKTLRAYGEDAKAHNILIAGRERERLKLPWWSPEKWWLWGLRWIIGYGYGSGELRALLWAIPFVVAGWIVAWRTAAPDTEGRKRGFWYSFDMLLPGMWLNESHAKVVLHGPAVWYFNVHRLAGYLLLLFVVSGLIGLAE